MLGLQDRSVFEGSLSLSTMCNEPKICKNPLRKIPSFYLISCYRNFMKITVSSLAKLWYFLQWSLTVEHFSKPWCTLSLTSNFSIVFKFTHCEMCRYLEFFWSVFSGIQTAYREIRNISPYRVQMWENTEQKNSEYRHYSLSVSLMT